MFKNASSFSHHTQKKETTKKSCEREKRKVCHGNWKLFNHEERRYFYGIIRDIKGESILKCNKRKEERKKSIKIAIGMGGRLKVNQYRDEGRLFLFKNLEMKIFKFNGFWVFLNFGIPFGILFTHHVIGKFAFIENSQIITTRWRIYDSRVIKKVHQQVNFI
jgi:hypothetical protein